jgi:hypothetical protein
MYASFLVASVSIGGLTSTSNSAFLSPSVALNVSEVKPSPKTFSLGNVTAIIDNIAKDTANTKYKIS